MVNVMWWVTKLFHIETLFFLFVLWCLWFVFLYRDDDKSDMESRMSHLLHSFTSISSGQDYDETLSFNKKKKSHSKRRFSNSGAVVENGDASKKKKYKSEERCREIFEGLFDKPFPSIRPDWLKSPQTGMNLELDGFCPDIPTFMGQGLAFEYDGQQHARYTPRFHASPKNFVSQCKRDIWKDKTCRERGVLVIRIPHHVRYEDLDMFIVTELGKHQLV